MSGGVSLARIKAAATDTGPLIHLRQVGYLKALQIVQRLLVSEEVVRELRGDPVLPRNCTVRALSGRSKDLVTIIASRFGVGPGESATIAVARQEGVRLVFTDDLEAREVAKEYGLEPHGTLALVARACREGILNRKEAIDCIEKLRSESSLYLTSDLVEWAKGELEPKHI